MTILLVCVALLVALFLGAVLGFQLGYQQARLEALDELLRFKPVDMKAPIDPYQAGQ
jgi:uncharacterized membrane protein affecting hemolysin expression